MSALPLRGRSVVITRARQQASKLRIELESLGARVIELPVIEIVPPDSYEPLDAALKNLHQYQWLVVTSANTVHVLRERMAVLGLGAASFSSVCCAAVGASTADALRELGVRIDVVPQTFVGEGLLEALRDRVAGCRVLLARAAVARDVLPDGLRQSGAVIDVVDAYRNVVPETSIALVQEIFSGEQLPDVALFTSSSTVTKFFQMLGKVALPAAVQVLSIGPITSATLREHGREPDAEAGRHDVQGLVEAAVQLLSP